MSEADILENDHYDGYDQKFEENFQVAIASYTT